MTNEASITVYKRTSKADEPSREVPANAPPADKNMIVRNVFANNQRVELDTFDAFGISVPERKRALRAHSHVKVRFADELQIGALRIEVSARDLKTAVDNAVAAGSL